MPSGRPSPFNDTQEALITGYIPAFEARVHELDPGLQGNNAKLLTQWKSKTAEDILEKPEFQVPDGEASKWRKVSRDTTHFRN